MKIAVCWQPVLVGLAISLLLDHICSVSSADNTTGTDTVPTAPAGYVTVISTPGSNYDYQTRLSDTNNAVTKYPKSTSSSVRISTNLHKGETILVLHDVTLILTDNSIEVYRVDTETHRAIFVDSLQLEPDCTSWYLLKSSSSTTDGVKIYVNYRDCDYTVFYYVRREFHGPFSESMRGIILGTRDREDVVVSTENEGQTLCVKEIVDGSTTLFPVNEIADCSVIQALYPLAPLTERTVNFAINCTTAGSTTKLYHAAYAYTQYSASIVLTDVPVDQGIPKSVGQHIAVIAPGRVLFLYDPFDLENGLPGRHRFSGEIERVLFVNDSWLLVQVDNSNVFAVHIDTFVSSRGREGVFELTDTHIGPCDPVCLPAISFEHYFGVFTHDALDSYSLVVFNLTTGSPEEVNRISNIPERPFAAIYLEDPNLTPTPTGPTSSSETQSATTSLPSVEPGLKDNTLTKVLSSTGASFLVLLLIGIVAIVGTVRRLKRRRQYSLTDANGSSTELDVPVNAVGGPGPTRMETAFAGPPQLPLNLGQGSADPGNDDEGAATTPTTPLLPNPIDVVDQPVIRQEEGEHQQVTAEGDQATHTTVMPS